MKNRFGNEIKVIDLGLRDKKHQVMEAEVRHLRNIRDRWRKYRQQNKVSEDSTLRTEQLCQLVQWKKQLSLLKERN